jgi:acyl-coenzyme A synthetase/AMP-(fatty) acid ligase
VPNQVIFRDSLPRTPNGKIDKRQLIDEAHREQPADTGCAR